MIGDFDSCIELSRKEYTNALSPKALFLGTLLRIRALCYLKMFDFVKGETAEKDNSPPVWMIEKAIKFTSKAQKLY